MIAGELQAMGNAHETRETLIRTLHGVLERDNSLSQCCAIRALEKLDARDSLSLEHLIELLLHPDPDVRTDVAVALGRMQISTAVEPLVRNLEGDPDGEVRIEVAKALCNIRSERSVEPLIRCIREDGYPELDAMEDDEPYNAGSEVLSQAVNALASIGDLRATDPLVELLKDEAYEDLQESGFRALVRLDDDKARSFLLEQLRHGNRLARRRALQAMATLPASEETTGTDPSPELLNALTNALVDQDPAVRSYAARAISSTRNPLVVVPLTMLLADPDDGVVTEAARALSKMPNHEVIDRLHSLLDEPKPALKKGIARVLGEIRDPRSVEPLSQLLATEDTALLYEAIVALGQIACRGPEQHLAELLTNSEYHHTVRVQAALALGRILASADTGTDDAQNEADDSVEDPRSVLTGAVLDTDERVRHAAMAALVELDPEHGAQVLTGILYRAAYPDDDAEPPSEDDATAPAGDEAAVADEKDPDRLAALVGRGTPETSTLAAILANQPEQAPVTPEETAVESEADIHETSTRIVAARLLGALHEPGSEAIASLISATGSSEPELRREALDALGRIGDKSALPVVLQALLAEERDIRLVALDALARLGIPDDAHELLANMLHDPDPIIRERAISALGTGDDARVNAYLIEALGDGDLGVCRAALAAIRQGNCDGSISEHILKLLFRFPGELQQEIGTTLARLRDTSATPRLLAIIDDPEQEEFHWICIDTLGHLHGRPTLLAAQ